MAFPTQEDHVLKGLDLVISQWRDKPKVMGLIESYLRGLNTAEELLFEILNETGVLVAEGVNLDLIGQLVNEDRDGEDDDQYRDRILNTISSRGISGTPTEVSQILGDFANATESSIFEHFPASFIPRVNVEYDSKLIERLQRIKPAGVRADQIIFDPYENGVVPAELSFGQDGLAENNDVLIGVDTDGNGSQDDTILIQQYDSPPTPRAILSELGDNTEEARFGVDEEVGLFGDPSLEAARFGQGGEVAQWALDEGDDNLTANGDLINLNILQDLVSGVAPCAELDAINEGAA